MKLDFTKLHGNGNDFVLVDEAGKIIIPEEEKPQFARRACDRHFGIGGDGLLFLSREVGNLRMRIFNSDGSEADMCGNGIRCFLKYAVDEGYADFGEVDVVTETGTLTAEALDREDETGVRVDMGPPAKTCKAIPAKGEGEFEGTIQGYKVYACNTGVPHAVVFVDDIDDFDVESEGPEIRYSEQFPEGANANFAQLRDGVLHVRTYERGVEAETLSCGTGATAAAVIANGLGKVGREVDVETRGGPLKISVEEETAYMEGPAVEVFRGVLDREELPESRPL